MPKTMPNQDQLYQDGRPFSQACENNKAPIVAILRSAFAPSKKVLEIGSGTGQHAVYFASELAHLCWQPSDRPEYHAGLKFWLNDYAGTNMLPLVSLDIEDNSWPADFDAVFSANTAHIMSWQQAQLMIAKVGAKLPDQGMFALYGPFNYGGEFSSESNARFEQWLKQGGAHQGIRDQEAVVACAEQAGMTLVCDHTMPANNRLLVFKKMQRPTGGRIS
ncbi:DUF938 domain-containing protein [Agaribacterium haliotis]|uniref:DUF938 domain-containing protein n=1 Tax=Agaribacterium haliotis TaxID=2013869 RepID=UPI001EFE58EB|nr:DUF938 domain-containing protein [Agaribacterium haliotis]